MLESSIPGQTAPHLGEAITSLAPAWLVWRVNPPFPEPVTLSLTLPPSLPESGGSKRSSLGRPEVVHTQSH